MVPIVTGDQCVKNQHVALVSLIQLSLKCKQSFAVNSDDISKRGGKTLLLK